MLLIIVVIITAGAEFRRYQDSEEEWHRLRYLQQSGVPVVATVIGKEVNEECGCQKYDVDYVYELPPSGGRVTSISVRIQVDKATFESLEIGSALSVLYDAEMVDRSELAVTVSNARPPAGFFPVLSPGFAGIIALIMGAAWFAARTQRLFFV